MTHKINRRDFFSALYGNISNSHTKKSNVYIYQGISVEMMNVVPTSKYVVFMEQNMLNSNDIKKSSVVSFGKFPHKKTDTFFLDLLKKEKIKALKKYVVTTKIPENSICFWDKIVWIASEVPERLPQINCPVLILQDIENFNPVNSPSDLLAFLPQQSDVFIAQKLDLFDENNPALKRVYDFLRE